jgi:excisionase family DNA binding protein
VNGEHRLSDASELARVLECSPRMALRLAERGLVPHYRIGRLVRFDLEEVLAALKHRAGGEA